MYQVSTNIQNATPSTNKNNHKRDTIIPLKANVSSKLTDEENSPANRTSEKPSLIGIQATGTGGVTKAPKTDEIRPKKKISGFQFDLEQLNDPLELPVEKRGKGDGECCLPGIQRNAAHHSKTDQRISLSALKKVRDLLKRSQNRRRERRAPQGVFFGSTTRRAGRLATGEGSRARSQPRVLEPLRTQVGCSDLLSGFAPAPVCSGVKKRARKTKLPKKSAGIEIFGFEEKKANQVKNMLNFDDFQGSESIGEQDQGNYVQRGD